MFAPGFLLLGHGGQQESPDQFEHLVRETMSGLLDKRAEGRFAHSHRSYAIDKISEIVAADSGHTVRLTGGGGVPSGRDYRSDFKAQLVQ